VAAKGAGVSALPQNVSDPNDADYEELGYEVATVGGAARATPFIHSRRNRAGEIILYGYDALDRMILKDRPGSEPDVAYTYDNRGLQLAATYAATGQYVSQAYDNVGRVLSTTTSMGATPRTVGYSWDADGNRQSMTYPDTSVVSYVNDGLDRVQNILDQSNVVLVTYAYDALGRRSSLTRGNGTATGYTYDGASRLHVLSQTAPPAYAAQNVDYTLDYNPAGQIVGRTVSNDTYVFALTAASTAYAANGKNQMVQAGSAGFTWDKKGNLTSDGTNSYTYSSENLLTGIVNPGGHYATASSPVYDPLGRLYQTGSNFDGNQAETVEDLAGEVVFEYATRSRTRRYVFGPEPDELLVQYFTYAPAPQFNSRTWYQSDERGSIASMTGDAGCSLPSSPEPIGGWRFKRRRSEAHRLLDRGERRLGRGAGALAAGGEGALELLRIGHQLADPGADRSDGGDQALGQRLLDRAVAAAHERPGRLLHRDSVQRGEDGQQVPEAGLIVADPDLAEGIGDGAADLAGDDRVLVGEEDDALDGIVAGLGHFPGRLLEIHHPPADLRNDRLGHLHRLAVAAVEALGDVAGQLDMLDLVLAHGHEIGLVEEDVGGL
jgi:YD repeat-containing protein